MSKKTIRKNIQTQAKKNKMKKNNTRDKVMNAIKLIVGVILFLLLSYVIAASLTGEYKLKDNGLDTSIILASKSFSQTSDNYYVIFYDFNGGDAEAIDSIISNNDDDDIYRVNLGDKMNSSYVGDISNKNAASAQELMVADTTLIRFVNNENSLYLEGIDSISSLFN